MVRLPVELWLYLPGKDALRIIAETSDNQRDGFGARRESWKGKRAAAMVATGRRSVPTGRLKGVALVVFETADSCQILIELNRMRVQSNFEAGVTPLFQFHGFGIYPDATFLMGFKSG